MSRFPVAAAKDTRAPKALRAKAHDWTSDLRRLRRQEAERLVEMATVLCPHQWLTIDAYRSVVLAIDQLAAATDIETLQEGLPLLDGPLQLPFSFLSEGNRVTVLRSLEGTPFFGTALRLVTRHLYDLPEVWAGCGYDGVGGYDKTARSDFDDETLSSEASP